MSVGGKAVKGVLWNMGTGLAVKMVALVGSLVVIRYISRSEYGEVQVASTCVLTATMISTLGTNQWLIARKATPGEAWHALMLHLGLGVLAYLAVWAVSPLIGPTMQAADMARFVPLFIISGFLEKIQYVPEKILARDLHFRAIALARGAGDIVYTVTAIALAPRVGGWAIAWGNIARAAVVATSMTIASDRSQWLTPTRLDKKTTKAFFVYGWPFGVGAFAEFISSKWDNLLVSHFFGTATLGSYTLAYQLAETPTNALADQIGAVLMPSFAQLAPEDRMKSLIRSGSLMAVIMFPLAIGLGAVAHTLFIAFFRPAWWDAATMLVILALLSIVKPLTWTLVGYTHAQQKRQLVMAMGIFKAVVLLATIALLGRFGILWTCAAVGIAFGIYAVVFLWLAVAPDTRAFWAYLGGALPPLLACVPMVAAVMAVRFIAHHFGIGPGLGSLFAEIGAGGLAYLIGAFTIARKTSMDLVNLVRNAVRRRRAPSPSLTV